MIISELTNESLLNKISELLGIEKKRIFLLSAMNGNSYTNITLFLDKPEDYFQWKILFNISFSDNISQIDKFSATWNYFLENKNCNSCKCELGLIGSNLEEIGFNIIDDNTHDVYLIKRTPRESINYNPYQLADIITSELGIQLPVNSISNNKLYDSSYYSYFPFGIVYRIDDLTDKKFYIGMTESEKGWDNGYMGSGARWNNHLDKHKDNDYKRTIIASNFDTPFDLRNNEFLEIKKYCIFDGVKYKVDRTTGCANLKLRTQGMGYNNTTYCPECGFKNHHKKTCSKYVQPKACEFCGSSYGKHKITCPMYVDPGVCPECGYSLQSRRHDPSCSHYVEIELSEKICEECGGKAGQHRKNCSLYTPLTPCPECGVIKGHKKSCSQYARKPCPECGVTNGHKDTCSRSKGFCPECGYSLQSRRHAPSCPHYKKLEICSECGGKNNRHRKTCSKYKPSKPCPECGKTNGHHTKECSHYKQRGSICSECGGKGGKHKKTCSKYIAHTVCQECGAIGTHNKTCSKFKKSGVCSECGGLRGNHKKSCSMRTKPIACPDCGAPMNHHKKACPQYVEKRKFCEECGAPINAHKKTCSHYKPPKPCPECGKTYGHHTKECSHYKPRKRYQKQQPGA